MADPLKNFGSRVRERRQEEGLTQAELAQELDISRTYLSQIEQGRARNLSLRLAQELTEKLDMDPPGSLRQQAPVGPALRKFAEKERLSEKQVQMLADLEMRGKRPTTEEQWRLLYNLIKTTMDSFD